MSNREKRDIEWLVNWALVDNGLKSRFVDGRLRTDWTDTGVRDIRSSWAGSAPQVVHDDAELVAQAIGELPPECAALIVRYGFGNDRPDWVEEGVGQWVQIVDGRGRLLWEYASPGNKRSARTPRMEFVGETQASVDFFRSAYSLWWVGLAHLVEPLAMALDRFEPTGPRAPEAPWLDPAVKVYDRMGRDHDRDGEDFSRLVSTTSAERIDRLARRGNLEMARDEAVNIHVAGGAIRE